MNRFLIFAVFHCIFVSCYGDVGVVGSVSVDSQECLSTSNICLRRKGAFFHLKEKKKSGVTFKKAINFIFDKFLKLFTSIIVRVGSSDIIKDKSGLLKVPRTFDKTFFESLVRNGPIGPVIMGTGEKTYRFHKLCNECIRRGCFQVLSKLIKSSINLNIINLPVVTLKLPKRNPTACYLILLETEAGMIAKDTAVFINGINVSLKPALSRAEDISRLCGINILLIYNASSGVFMQELVRGFLAAKKQVSQNSNPTIVNIKRGLRLAVSLNDGEPFIVFAHSDGSSLFRAAMQEMDWKLGHRICYFAAGPASVVESRSFLSAFQVVSTRDPIPSITNSSAALSGLNLSRIPAASLSPIFDHFLVSPTYFRQIEKFVDDFRGLSYE